jgi:hypothetical protein
MEEIDIIELLKRVKEGKAPKRIEINETKYEFKENYSDVVCIYQTEEDDVWLEYEAITLDTKIKILDKPIIEELKPIDDGYISKSPDNFEIMAKINEIIKYINSKEKE